MKESPLNEIDTLKSPAPSNPLQTHVIAYLLTKGLKQTEIARMFGVSPQAVNQFIDSHSKQLEILKKYDDYTPALLKAKVVEIINTLDIETIKRAGLKDRMTSVGIAIDKHQQLEGKLPQTDGNQILVQEMNVLINKIEVVEKGQNEAVNEAKTVDITPPDEIKK